MNDEKRITYEIPEAFAVAMAEHPGKRLVRCSCGALHPVGELCPSARVPR